LNCDKLIEFNLGLKLLFNASSNFFAVEIIEFKSSLAFLELIKSFAVICYNA
jgi:hypothetical protein